MDREPNKGSAGLSPKAARYLAVASQLPASVIAGFLVGYGLDYLLGTSLLRVLFLVIGVGGGIYAIFRELSRDD